MIITDERRASVIVIKIRVSEGFLSDVKSLYITCLIFSTAKPAGIRREILRPVLESASKVTAEGFCEMDGFKDISARHGYCRSPFWAIKAAIISPSISFLTVIYYLMDLFNYLKMSQLQDQNHEITICVPKKRNLSV